MTEDLTEVVLTMTVEIAALRTERDRARIQRDENEAVMEWCRRRADHAKAERDRLRDGIDQHKQAVEDASVMFWREPQDLLDMSGKADETLWSLLDPEDKWSRTCSLCGASYDKSDESKHECDPEIQP